MNKITSMYLVYDNSNGRTKSYSSKLWHKWGTYPKQFGFYLVALYSITKFNAVQGA